MVRTKPYDSTLGAAALLVPTLVVLVVFLYYPALETVRLSLQQTLLLGTRRTFVGLDNYVTILTSSTYHTSVLVSFAFAAAVVVGTLAASLFVAYLLFLVKTGESGYLLVAIWPYALPTAVAGTILLFMLHPSLGIVTYYLEAATGLSLDWFTSGPLAFAVVALVAVWKQLGYNIVFLVAALNNVPETLTESAKLDGVGHLRMLSRVYVPLISPTMAFLVVINTIYAFFGTFPLVDLMTSGGPNNATNLLIFKLYRDAFEFNNLGKASAESVVLFAIVSILMYVQIRFTDRHAHYGG